MRVCQVWVVIALPMLLFLDSYIACAQSDSNIIDALLVDTNNSAQVTAGNDSGSMQGSSGIISHLSGRSMPDLQAYYLQWRDQFPSRIIQMSYGTPQFQHEEILRKGQSEDWKFYLALLLLMLLAFIRYGYAKEFDELFTVFRNWGPSQQMFRELGTGVSFGTVLLNFFSVLVISLFVFLLLSTYQFLHTDPAWLMMLIALATVTLFLLARYTLLKAAAMLLPFGKEITLYNFYEIQINRLLGVVMFPMVLLISFSTFPINRYALYASLLVLAVFVFMRYLKGFNIGINYFGRHLFHFLLYICALEIAPVLIIIRLLQNLGPLRFSF